MKQIITIISISLVFLTLLSSCVKEDFDTVPEKEYTVDFEANATIAELKELYRGSNVLVDENIIIKGVITANDESGNFYKELYLQDSTGAMNLRIDQTNMYIDYPIGQLVYIKCSGLYLGTFNDVFQLGYSRNVDRINEAFIENYIFKSDGGEPIEPKVVSITELNDEDLGMLIKLENVQFKNPDQTYADGDNQTDRTTVLEDCEGNELDVRNSGYATFANDDLPDGNGSIIGIHGKYFDYQLKIRTTEEVELTGDRCNK
jgi:hypothetical protein